MAGFDNDEESERLFGYAPPGERGRLVPVLLSAGVALLLGVAGILYVQRPAHTRTFQVSAVLYGVAGPQGVCTEQAIDTTGAWNCLAWQANDMDAQVVAPQAYGGPCSHVVADQTRGAWTCVDA